MIDALPLTLQQLDNTRDTAERPERLRDRLRKVAALCVEAGVDRRRTRGQRDAHARGKGAFNWGHVGESLREQREAKLQFIQSQLVERVEVRAQPRSLAADVADLNRKIERQLALQFEILLRRASVLEVLVEIIHVGAVQIADYLRAWIGDGNVRIIFERKEGVETEVDVDRAGAVAERAGVAEVVVDDRRVVDAVAAAHDRLVVDRVSEADAGADVGAVRRDQSEVLGLDRPAQSRRQRRRAARPPPGSQRPGQSRAGSHAPLRADARSRSAGRGSK